LGNNPRCTPFETFPFPDGLTLDILAADYASDPYARAIARAAARLDALRRNWINPPDLVDVVPEVVPGFPDRLIPKNDEAAAELKKRTLTNLYNARPAWLAKAHADLDAAVAGRLRLARRHRRGRRPSTPLGSQSPPRGADGG
jgi:hypothetical protein